MWSSTPSRIGLADGRGFLADRQMRRAAVVVFDALVVAAQLDLIEHVLEGADDHHVALDAQQVVFGEAPDASSSTTVCCTGSLGSARNRWNFSAISAGG